MKTLILCATCASPLEFEVPQLTHARWHALCAACGKATALEAILGIPGELASFKATGVFVTPKSSSKRKAAGADSAHGS
jgi:hypothetical protein